MEKKTKADENALSKSRNGDVKDTNHEYFSEIMKDRTKERNGNDQASARQSSKKNEYDELSGKFILLVH